MRSRRDLARDGRSRPSYPGHLGLPTEIQTQFPHLFKLGPNTKMNEIVHAHLPGAPLVHMPAPPPQIRAITDHVYFFLDRASPLWPELSTASAIGMHFSGDWPELQHELWAIMEARR